MIKRFNRFELKYIVRIGTCERLVAEVAEQMSPDRMGEAGVYPVTSLYYDTADLQFYRSKIDGVKYRRKVRIRLYGPAPDPSANPTVMVEIKQRINRTTQKRRVALPLREAYALCRGHLERTWSDERDEAVASEVAYLARSLHLRPTCVVGYVRRAFAGGPFEPGLRLTFDHDLWARPPGDGLLDHGQRYAVLRPELAVLEVKANDAVPLWVSRMLARNGCTLERISKYCAGVARVVRDAPAARGVASWMS
jgi:SPX domain protein involved in polyphosphate accumulation